VGIIEVDNTSADRAESTGLKAISLGAAGGEQWSSSAHVIATAVIVEITGA